MQFDGIDVTRYKYLMWTLVSRAGDPKMSTLVQHTAKKASFEERMAIVKGINYIAEPCVRVLDFRMYFYELCQAYEFEGVRHFMDEQSIQVFNALIDKTGGKYTVGVFDELNSYAKKRYAELPEEFKNRPKTIAASRKSLNRQKIPELAATGVGNDVSEQDIPVEALQASVEQRIFEGHFLTHSASLCYTLASGLENFRPLTVLVNEQNKAFWQSLQMEQHSCLVSALLMRPEFQSVLAQAQDVSKYYLIKRILVNDQLDFVALEFNKLRLVLAQYPELSNILQDGELKLVRIDIVTESAADQSFVPSILASENNLRLKSINRPPSDKVMKVLSQSQKLLTISDQSHVLDDLQLLKEFRQNSKSANDLPISLLQFVIRPRYPTKPVYKAVLNTTEARVEERYTCNTSCIIICKNSKQSFVGKTVNLSSKGLAVKLSAAETDAVKMEEQVYVSLPGVCKRMGQTVKNQPYKILELKGDVARLKIAGTKTEHQGRRQLQAFLSRYYHQLKTSGVEEDISGLGQALRSSASAHHPIVPFSYVVDGHGSYIQDLYLNSHCHLSNLDKQNHDEDMINLVSSQAFSDTMKGLYEKMLKTGQSVTGYLLLLPRIKTKSGVEHQYWLQDLSELVKKNTGFEFIEKLHKIGQPSVMSVRLCPQSGSFGKYALDELNHLKRIAPTSAELIESRQQNMTAYGEIQEITDLFYLERPLSEEELLIDVDGATH